MESTELSIAATRRHLADVLHATTVRGQIIYITNRGRRVAAIVPVPVAEQARQESS